MEDERVATERLEHDLRLTVDRLRGMGLARLAAGFEPEPSRADAARQVAQRLADLAADLEGRPRRPLPRLSDAAVGDQLAVCGHDVLAAASTAPAASVALTEAADLLLDLRRRV